MSARDTLAMPGILGRNFTIPAPFSGDSSRKNAEPRRSASHPSPLLRLSASAGAFSPKSRRAAEICVPFFPFFPFFPFPSPLKKYPAPE